MNKSINSFKLHFKEYIKFNIIGFINFAVSQLVYITLFTFFKINYILAYTLTSILSVSASYFFNSKITFKQTNYCPIKFSLSAIVYMFEYIINMSIIILLVNHFRFSKLIAPLVSPTISTPIVFILMRNIIKRNTIKKET